MMMNKKQNYQTRGVFDPVLETAAHEFLRTVYLKLPLPVYYETHATERQPRPDERKPAEIGRVM